MMKKYCFNDEWIGFQKAELNFVIATHLQNTCTIWVSRVRVILHSWFRGFVEFLICARKGEIFWEKKS